MYKVCSPLFHHTLYAYILAESILAQFPQRLSRKDRDLLQKSIPF